MADLTIKAGLINRELLIGSGHPTLPDTLNRLTLVEHNTDGTHKTTLSLTVAGLTDSGLTSGYLPYAAATTKLFTNSPIYTDGTNVGIGTTSPWKKLEVHDGTDNNIDFRQGSDMVGGGSGLGLASLNDAHNAYGMMVIGANPAVFWGGNVGIGTTSPSAKLAINGGLHIGGDSDPGDNNLLVDGTATCGALTTDGGLQTFGAPNSGGAGYRLVLVPN